jgi:hypothetical protein
MKYKNRFSTHTRARRSSGKDRGSLARRAGTGFADHVKPNRLLLFLWYQRVAKSAKPGAD